MIPLLFGLVNLLAGWYAVLRFKYTGAVLFLFSIFTYRKRQGTGSVRLLLREYK